MKIVNTDHLIAYLYKMWGPEMSTHFGKRAEGTERNTLVYINGIFDEYTAQQIFSHEARYNMQPDDYFEIFAAAKIIYIGYTKTDFKTRNINNMSSLKSFKDVNAGTRGRNARKKISAEQLKMKLIALYRQTNEEKTELDCDELLVAIDLISGILPQHGRFFESFLIFAHNEQQKRFPGTSTTLIKNATNEYRPFFTEIINDKYFMRELTTICIQFMKLYPIDSKKTLEGSFIDIDEHFFGMVEDENEQHKTDSLYDEDVEIPSTQEAERLEIQKQKDKQNAFNARIELIENALSHMPPTDYIEDLIMLNAESTIIEMVQVMHKSPMTIVQYQNIRNDYFEYIRNNERYQSKMILNFLRFKYVDMIPVTKLLRASENRYNKMRAQYQQFMSSKTSKELVEQDISYLQYLGLSWLDLAMMAEWRYGFLACYDTSRDLVIVDTLMQDIATTTEYKSNSGIVTHGSTCLCKECKFKTLRSDHLLIEFDKEKYYFTEQVAETKFDYHRICLGHKFKKCQAKCDIKLPQFQYRFDEFQRHIVELFGSDLRRARIRKIKNTEMIKQFDLKKTEKQA